MLTLVLLLSLQEPPLSREETATLDQLFNEGLFDPAAAKARRVRGTITLRTCYGKTKSIQAPGWLIPAEAERPARLLLNNLQEVRAPDDLKPADLAAEAAGREIPGPRLSEGGIFVSSDVQHFVWAAWLHRLGRDDEASRQLRRPMPADPIKRFRDLYGWSLFDLAVNAYIVGVDADALPALDRLVRFESGYLEDGKALLAEVRRRKEAGTFGKPPSPLPEDLDTWPMEKRIDFLVAALDQIDPGKEEPGYVTLDGQPSARHLIACGEAAVPALLRCIEEDPRLTRSIHVWREWNHHRWILPVRGAALRILGGILRTRPWLSVNLMAPEEIRESGRILNRYWEDLGKIPFPERMMRLLKDPATTVQTQHEAAENLARLDGVPSLDWGRWLPADDPLRQTFRPELASFKDPTAAEAILAAMDRHLSTIEQAERIEEDYLTYLGELGDRRIVPALLLRHGAAKDAGTRRRLAFCLCQLGENGPIDALARDVEAGAEVPDIEARKIVDAIGRAATPACDAALATIARKGHPLHPTLREVLLEWEMDDYDRRAWFAHPYCITLLHAALGEVKTTGAVIAVEGKDVTRRGEDGRYRPGIFLGETKTLPEDRKEKAVERVCDLAALQLSRLIPDAPHCHPLLKDSEARLRELREYMDRNTGKFRRMTRAELACYGFREYQVRYVSGP